MNTGNTPLPVTIIRPPIKWVEAFGRITGGICGYFLTAWLVMLIAAAQTPWHPGYWQVFFLIVGVRLVLPTTSSYRMWTKRPGQ